MTVNTESRIVGSGIAALDTIIQGLRLGDNVVWQLDDFERLPAIR